MKKHKEMKGGYNMSGENKHGSYKLSNSQILVIIAIGLLLALVVFNSIRITNQTPSSGSTISNIIPTGIPDIYGEELGISYDDVSASTPDKADATIEVLSNIDRTVTLTGADLERYVKIGSMIACEYCCGAKTLVFSNGQAACGCAHSYAMRGVAKYLITNHGSEYTDEEILEELGKWKVLFFPDVHAQKAAVLESQGIELNYINLASNKYRGAEKGSLTSGGSMVGGC